MSVKTFAEAMEELQAATDDLRFTMARMLVTSWYWRLLKPILRRKAKR